MKSLFALIFLLGSCSYLWATSPSFVLSTMQLQETQPEKEEILIDDDDLLLDEEISLEDAPTEAEATTQEVATEDDYHGGILREGRFPSADTCKTCHPNHYDQWSASPHAYSQMSPVANAMNGKMQQLTNGSMGDFCMRCHSPVSMALEEPIFMSNMDRHPASREGITCVACHRIDRELGKVVGRLKIAEGAITDPVYGPTGNHNLKKVLSDPNFRVVTDPQAKGRKIHGDAKQFSYISSSDFCGGCHEVTLVNGMRLEETFTEYKHSPAATKGVTCQDCHMATVPGVPSPYDQGPAAIVGGIPTEPRKLTNHMFAGPDYSLIHPGIYPHNAEAAAMATIREWLTFDYKAGWGTDAFEDQVSDDAVFPERWASIDDRYDAREILKRQFRLLDEAAVARRQLLQTAYRLGAIEVLDAGPSKYKFKVQVNSGTDGHNAPTGFERIVYLRVTVTDKTGKVVFISGDLDPNGDLRDDHSEYVKNGELPLDPFLFNLQSKFVTRNIRGAERPQILGANFSVNALPYVRPDAAPNMLRGRPLGARIHKKGIEPNGSRYPKYQFKATPSNGPYTANVKLIAGMIPVNLINAIKDAGIDYYMTPRELAEKLVEGHQVLWERDVKLDRAPTYEQLPEHRGSVGGGQR